MHAHQSQASCQVTHSILCSCKFLDHAHSQRGVSSGSLTISDLQGPQEIEGHSAVSDGSLVGSLPWKGGCLLHWCYRQRLLNRKHFIYCFVQDEIFNALSFYDDAFKSRNLRFSWACAHILDWGANESGIMTAMADIVSGFQKSCSPL